MAASSDRSRCSRKTDRADCRARAAGLRLSAKIRRTKPRSASTTPRTGSRLAIHRVLTICSPPTKSRTTSNAMARSFIAKLWIVKNCAGVCANCPLSQCKRVQNGVIRCRIKFSNRRISLHLRGWRGMAKIYAFDAQPNSACGQT